MAWVDKVKIKAEANYILSLVWYIFLVGISYPRNALKQSKEYKEIPDWALLNDAEKEIVLAEMQQRLDRIFPVESNVDGFCIDSKSTHKRHLLEGLRHEMSKPEFTTKGQAERYIAQNILISKDRELVLNIDIACLSLLCFYSAYELGMFGVVLTAIASSLFMNRESYPYVGECVFRKAQKWLDLVQKNQDNSTGSPPL
jgi:hypothetical protein